MTRRMSGAVVLAALLLSGCGGGGVSDSGDSAVVDKGAAGAPEAARESGGGSADGGAVGGTAPEPPVNAGRVVPGGREIVYTGDLTVRVKDATAAAERAERLVRARQGVVFGEDAVTDPEETDRSTVTMTLRVPPEQFRPLLRDLAGLGERLSQHQSAEDVTSQVVDVESRLASQRASVARLRALLSRATSIGDIVRVEGELARREADLEALEAQRKKLADLTALATVTATFVGPAAEPPPAEDLGFLAGLRRGWAALTAAVAVGLTVLGALLPFAIAIALVVAPALALLRGRRQRRRTPESPAAPPA